MGKESTLPLLCRMLSKVQTNKTQTNRKNLKQKSITVHIKIKQKKKTNAIFYKIILIRHKNFLLCALKKKVG